MPGYKMLKIICLLLPCLALACEQTRSVQADTGAVDLTLANETGITPDMPALKDKGPDSLAALDKSTPADSAQVKDKPSPTPDKTVPVDSELKADKAAADAGACQNNGQSCLKNACCAGLKCCTGMPVPPGQAVCYKTCPMSDRALKYGLRSLSSDDVLRRLTRLPISTWTYNNEPPDVRHIGPMAQDFHAAFGVGSDPRFISPVDADGVALVALQALHRQLQRLRAELTCLKKENKELRRDVKRLSGSIKP